MAVAEIVTPSTLKQAHRRIAALEKDLAKAKELGGVLTQTMAWESDKPEAQGVPCACSDAASERADNADLRRQLLEAHKAKDRAEEFLRDLFDLADAWRK